LSPSWKRALLLVGVLTLGLTLARLAPVAHAVSPGCGDTITTPGTVTLTSDIGPCAGNGLVIGASVVVINCAGYSITGTNTPDTFGISDTGYNGLTVENCAISKFSIGILLVDVWHGTITGNTANGNGNTGIAVDSDAYFDQSEYNLISGNTVENNGYYGIGLYVSSYNDISSNTALNDGSAGIIMGGWYACIYGVTTCSTGNTIQDNRADGQEYGFNDESTGGLGTGSGTSGTWNTYYDNECHGNTVESLPAGLCGAWNETGAPEFPFGLALLFLLLFPALLVLRNRTLSSKPLQV